MENKEPLCKYAPIFYGHLQAIEKLDEATQLKLFKAICYFCFYAIEPEEEDIIVQALFTSFKDVLENSAKRYKANVENGKKGGAPKGNKNASKTTQNNPIQPNSTQNKHGKEKEEVKEKGKEKEEELSNIKSSNKEHEKIENFDNEYNPLEDDFKPIEINNDLNKF